MFKPLMAPVEEFEIDLNGVCADVLCICIGVGTGGAKGPGPPQYLGCHPFKTG